MITDDARASDLALFGGGGLDDAELERRVEGFRGALRRLHEDPAEAARVAAIADDADSDVTLPGAIPVYVTGRDITVYLTQGPDTTLGAAREGLQAELYSLDQERMRLGALLQDAEDRLHARRAWRLMLPASTMLVAILGGAGLIALTHASAVAATIAGVTLAVTAAITALVSQVMIWTSVRQLNREGRAHTALTLLHAAAGKANNEPELRAHVVSEYVRRSAPDPSRMTTGD